MLPRIPVAADVARSWVIEQGWAPALAGGRAPDGSLGPRQFTIGDRPSISEVMTDLHRRVPGEIDPRLVQLVPWSRLLHALREASSRPGVQRLRAFGTPGPLLARYIMAEVLAEATDDEGRFDLEAFRRLHYPPEVDTLLGWLGRQPLRARAKCDEDAPFEICLLFSEAWWLPREDFDVLFPNLVVAIAREQRARARAEPMALVDMIAERYGPPHPDDFVWAREHILGSNATRAAASRFARAGKGYSSSTPVLVLEALAHRLYGCTMDQVVVTECDGRSLLDAVALGLATEDSPLQAEAMLNATLEVDGLRHGLSRPFHRFQVVDSGGTALLALASLAAGPEAIAPEDAGFADRGALLAALSGVEHTRDGARQLRDAVLPFPVVDAAESPVKLNMVALLVAWSIVEEVNRNVAGLEGQGVRVGRRALIVGFGSTGSRVAQLLRAASYQVTVKDPDPKARRAAEAAGFPAIAEVPPDLDVGVVVGCVGLPSLDPEELQRLPSGTILFSGSSSNKEFAFWKEDGWVLSPLGRGADPPHESEPRGADDRPRAEPAGLGPWIEFQGRRLRAGNPCMSAFLQHDRVVRSRAGRELLLVRSLYPVNLTGHPDPISPVLAQLIRALMLLGSFQARALPPGTVGLVPLEVEGQRWIAGEFMKIARALDPPLPPVVASMLEEEYARTSAALDAEAERRT